jgi:hypothetical protein
MWGNPWRAQEDRRGLLEAVHENAGRHVILNGEFVTEGTGEIANPDRFEFGLILPQKPNVSYSYSLDDADLVETVYPRCWGGVSDWITNANGHYVAASVFVVVTAEPLDLAAWTEAGEPEAPWYTITHHFTFNGIALKFATAETYALRGL